MPTTLGPITADKATAGGIVVALKLCRWCITKPDYMNGRSYTPLALYPAWRMVRSLIWDAVDDCSDINRSQGHADAVADELGLTGVLERVNAIDHHWRMRSTDVDELVGVVERQLAGAITRLEAAIAEPAQVSN